MREIEREKRWNRIAATTIITKKKHKRQFHEAQPGPTWISSSSSIPFGLAQTSQTVGRRNYILFYFFSVVVVGGWHTHTHGPLVAGNVIIKSNNHHHHHDNGNIARRCKYDMTRRAAPDMMRRQTNAFCMIITFSIIIISLFSKEKNSIWIFMFFYY